MGRNMTSYKHWLVKQVDSPDICLRESYNNLINHMFETDFFYFSDIPGANMDRNREEDGLYLRVTYNEETGKAVETDRNCSILEVLVALAIRIEQDIMGEGDNDYAKWFKIMLNNLELLGFDDIHYDSAQVDLIFHRFMYRNYVGEGKYSLFPLKNYENCSDEYVKLEIWSQLQYFLTENFG